MSSGDPHVRGSVPAVSVVPVDIAGRMGRGYLMLPCKHHRANFPDPYTVTRPHVRKCATCGIRYQVTFRLGDKPAEAQMVRLS